jgi:CheY-like chemotaxis protein/PAS domain-containing protein
MIEAALRAHPFVVRGERILANPYFVPADSRFGARQSVDRMLRHLDRLAVATADEPLLRHVLDALPHGVLFCDGAGVIRVINRPVAALLARPADSLVGAPLGSLFADGSPPSGWPRMNGSDLRRLRLRRGDGRVCWAAATAHQISAAGHLLVLLDTEPAGWHSVGVDAEARSDPLGRLIDPADERALPTRRFLVASSAPALAETLSMLLIADGHGVVVAASGEEAQRLVNSTPLDAVLIDLDDGSAAWGTQIRELRATCPRVPIVLITAWEASIDPALARDASALLIKPFSRRHLREALTSCLVRRPMQELGE